MRSVVCKRLQCFRLGKDSDGYFLQITELPWPNMP